MEFYKALDGISNEIQKNYDMILDTNRVVKNKLKSVPPEHFHASYHRFYEQVQNVDISWRHFKFEKLNHVCGKIKILPLKEVMGDWEGIVWFKKMPDQDDLKNFRILDFFVDEACVGFYDLPDKTEALYYLYLEDRPVRLGLNLEGYVEMLVMTRGYFYWQTAVIELITGKESKESRDFKKYMPQLFSDFKYESFVELYHQVRIK